MPDSEVPARSRESDLRRGPVEQAVRLRVPLDTPLFTLTGRSQFFVDEYRPSAAVLLLGAKRARTLMPWPALETVPDLLRGRGWITISGVFSEDSRPGTLDAHLKQWVNRATAGWVAVLLEQAGVIDIDRTPAARVRLAQHR